MHELALCQAIADTVTQHAEGHAVMGVEVRIDHFRGFVSGWEIPAQATSPRAGHWGLPGMRERVDRFGGKLEFWSEAGAGAEAVLTVPAAAAYGASNGGPFSFLRRKKARS